MRVVRQILMSVLLSAIALLAVEAAFLMHAATGVVAAIPEQITLTRKAITGEIAATRKEVCRMLGLVASAEDVVSSQWPWNPATPGGAWEFHRTLIPNNPVKPIRLWMEVGDRDNLSANSRDNMHDWVLANENMAKVLAAKGYHYQFVFARNAGHTDHNVKQQTLPEALEWVWQGYVAK